MMPKSNRKAIIRLQNSEFVCLRFCPSSRHSGNLKTATPSPESLPREDAVFIAYCFVRVVLNNYRNSCIQTLYSCLSCAQYKNSCAQFLRCNFILTIEIR